MATLVQLLANYAGLIYIACIIGAAFYVREIYRLEQGNFSNVKSAGQGVSELRIDFGPGYRIYFGREGNTLLILLGGGSKKTQSRDIRNAQSLWAQYKTEKKKEK